MFASSPFEGETMCFPYSLVAIIGHGTNLGQGDIRGILFRLIPGLGRSPGEGKGYPLRYSGLENSMDCRVQGGRKESDMIEWLSLSFAFLRKEMAQPVTWYFLFFCLVGRPQNASSASSVTRYLAIPVVFEQSLYVCLKVVFWFVSAFQLMILISFGLDYQLWKAGFMETLLSRTT